MCFLVLPNQSHQGASVWQGLRPQAVKLPVKSPYTKTHLNMYCNNYNVIQMNPIVCLAVGTHFERLIFIAYST